MKKLIDTARSYIRSARDASLSGKAMSDANNALTVLRAAELTYNPAGYRRDEIIDLRSTAKNIIKSHSA